MENKPPKNIGSAFWQDSFKVWGAISPVLASVWWIYKWIGEPPPQIKELSWAWGLAPLMGWVMVAYCRRWMAYKEIADRLIPKFNLSLDFSDHEVPGTNVLVGFKFVNVCVKNTSEVNLEKCTALLESILKDGKPTAFHKSIPLEWSFPLHANEKEIVAGAEGIVHVVTSGSHNHGLNFWNTIKWARLENVFDDPGIYDFLVRVNCGGFSDTIEFMVEWNGNWQEITAKEK